MEFYFSLINLQFTPNKIPNIFDVTERAQLRKADEDISSKVLTHRERDKLKRSDELLFLFR